MSELRTTLGDLRRTEKDIIINFNNSSRFALRESGPRPARCASAWPMCAGAVGRCRFCGLHRQIAGFMIKQYETGISPIFEKIGRAQLDGSGWAAPTPIRLVHMEATDKLFSSRGLGLVRRWTGPCRRRTRAPPPWPR